MISIKPRKQRRELFNAPLHKKRKWVGAHLEENLLLKYDKRAVTVVKGDTVKVMRGSFRGHEDKIVKVNIKKQSIEIEGITMSKADGNKIAKPIHPSNVMITKLNLTDKWRRQKLERGLSEDTKKEIEVEAEKQIKESEEEARIKEEEAKELEKKETIEEEVEESKEVEKPEKKEELKEKKPKAKVEKKAAPKTKAKKEEPKKKVKTSKKMTATKKPSEKKPKKKIPAKTTKKKGGK